MWRGGEGGGSLYLHREVVLDLVQGAGRGEARDAVHGELLAIPRQHAFVVSELAGGEDEAEVGEVACFRHLDADGLVVLGERLDGSPGFVAFVVVDDLFVDADRD